MYSQYDIVLVDFNPVKGSEIGKTRPCVILSPNEMNRHINTIIVAPMTSTDKNYPSRVKIKKSSYIVLDQIRTIDKTRVLRKLDTLSGKIIKNIKKVIQEMLVD